MTTMVIHVTKRNEGSIKFWKRCWAHIWTHRISEAAHARCKCSSCRWSQVRNLRTAMCDKVKLQRERLFRNPGKPVCERPATLSPSLHPCSICFCHSPCHICCRFWIVHVLRVQILNRPIYPYNNAFQALGHLWSPGREMPMLWWIISSWSYAKISGDLLRLYDFGWTDKN